MTEPLNPLHVDASRGESIAFASSDRAGARQWTELAVYFVPDPSGRCFLAEAKGCTRVEGQVTRRRAVYVGTLDRALEFFDDGDLKDSIVIQANDWLDRNPNRVAEALKQLRAEEQGAGRSGPSGYTGSTLLGAVAWLYGDAQAGKAARLAEDFGVPRRTVAHALDQEQAGQGLTGWAKAFVSALRFFDRGGFLEARGAS